MGQWTVYLTKDEEQQIKRLVAERKYRSVYHFIRRAVQSYIASLEKAEGQNRNYWWRENKESCAGIISPPSSFIAHYKVSSELLPTVSISSFFLQKSFSYISIGNSHA